MNRPASSGERALWRSIIEAAMLAPWADNRPALQAYVEAAQGMFYGGIWSSTVDLDDPVRRRPVAPQPRPPLVEGGSIIGIRRSECSHPDGLGIRRVLEQHAEITIFDLAKDELSRALPHGR